MMFIMAIPKSADATTDLEKKLEQSSGIIH
jgi:hypothetical protein